MCTLFTSGLCSNVEGSNYKVCNDNVRMNIIFIVKVEWQGLQYI